MMCKIFISFLLVDTDLKSDSASLSQAQVEGKVSHFHLKQNKNLLTPCNLH